MGSVLLSHVVADLTVGKPELVEFLETETVESAIRELENYTEGGIPVWMTRQKGFESVETKQQRFVGIVNSMDVIAFLARESSLADHETALRTPVSEMVVPNCSILRCVDPGTRESDAFLYPQNMGWKVMGKCFSVLYNGKWHRNIETSRSASNGCSNRFSSATPQGNWCCLSREDVLRFLIGCLGALAPLPLLSISSLDAVTPNFLSINASSPAIHAFENQNYDPSAVAVVEQLTDGQLKIIGEISSSKLWKCDYLSAAWAVANLSVGDFVLGVEDISPLCIPNMPINNTTMGNGGGGSRPKKFSSRSVGLFNSQVHIGNGVGRIYRGRSVPLTCKTTSSLAAVMAQMLSHRATHVWVTEDQDEEVLVGIVTCTDILWAVTRPPNLLVL